MADQNQQQQPQEYSWADIETAIQAGKINEAQGRELWATQERTRAERIARETATNIVTTERDLDRVDNQLKEYAALAPDLVKEGSPLRQRVQAAYEELCNNGSPDNLATQYAAVRSVLGTIDRVRQHAQGKRVDPQPFGDTAGGRNLTPQQRREEEAWGRLTQRQRDHYEDALRKRIYPDRAAVFRELDRYAKRAAGIDPDAKRSAA